MSEPVGKGTQPQAPIDLAIAGAGAAGLMAGILAGRAAKAAGTGRRPRIVIYDSARTLGAKILVAGGGRCNVTHYAVSERDYCGATPPAIRKVLQRFSVETTRDFFREIGVELKREATGKLFPVTNRARTVLDALLRAARDAGVEIDHPCRVARIERTPAPTEPSAGDGAAGDGAAGDGAAGDGAASADATSAGAFRLSLERDHRAPGGARHEIVHAKRVIMATGGCALPKSGSDGHGHVMARALGHTTTTAIFPALVPLVLEGDCFLRGLSGIAVPTRLTVVSASGKRLAMTENATLLTHFGLSGPAVLDISRHLTAARRSDPVAALEINWCPTESAQALDEALCALGKRSVHAWLRGKLADRLADAMAGEAGLPAYLTGTALTRTQRKALLGVLCALQVPVTGDRGFTFAETTAGGVPLAEIDLKTMQSRRCSGLYLIGEILDVDGRIGGFNFQWAWASGFVAGTACGAVQDSPR